MRRQDGPRCSPSYWRSHRRQITRDLLGRVGALAQVPLEALSTDAILEFKERRLSGGWSPRAVNQTIKILKRSFRVALDEELIDRNPVAVRPIRETTGKRGVLNREQIQRLLEAAEDDWRGIILAGYFTGPCWSTWQDLPGTTSCRERLGLLFRFRFILEPGNRGLACHSKG